MKKYAWARINRKKFIVTVLWFLFLFGNIGAYPQAYKIVSTDVAVCYDTANPIPCPTSPGDPFYGQFPGVNLPSFQANNNGTVTDLVTGLTWQKSPDQNGNNDGVITIDDKLTWPQIQARLLVLNSTSWGGFSDWRIPTIKELYSLTNWNGTDPSGLQGTNTSGLTPFLDTNYFPFAYGNPPVERIIDVQYASGNLYQDNQNDKLFGFNFADGRIKGYGLIMPGGGDKVFSFIAVRGNSSYGFNHFTDNGDQTVTDSSTGLMWTRDDSQVAMNWEQALAWAQGKNAANYCGHNDWRLPNTKELQSIVDYTRTPESNHSAAIDPVFTCTSIINEAGYPDWPWFWTSTTHLSYDGTAYHGGWAVYVCFGTAGGWMQLPGNTYYSYVDVHGAGAQRSSPKCGTWLGDYMGLDSLGNPVYGKGPQGDVIRVNNFVRLVRDVMINGINDREGPERLKLYPNPANVFLTLDLERLPGGIATMEIMNSLGQVVVSREIPVPQTAVINLGKIVQGCYTVKVLLENSILTGKFIRN